MSQDFVEQFGPINRTTFERDVEDLLGDRIRSSESAAIDLWSALANVQWTKGNGKQVVDYSFSTAAGLVLEIGGKGSIENYRTECFAHGQVADWIRDGLGERGWRFVPIKVPAGGFLLDFSQPRECKRSSK